MPKTIPKTIHIIQDKKKAPTNPVASEVSKAFFKCFSYYFHVLFILFSNAFHMIFKCFSYDFQVLSGEWSARCRGIFSRSLIVSETIAGASQSKIARVSRRKFVEKNKKNKDPLREMSMQENKSRGFTKTHEKATRKMRQCSCSKNRHPLSLGVREAS